MGRMRSFAWSGSGFIPVRLTMPRVPYGALSAMLAIGTALWLTIPAGQAQEPKKAPQLANPLSQASIDVFKGLLSGWPVAKHKDSPVDPQASLTELLPTPPQPGKQRAPLFVDELACVPEVMLEMPLERRTQVVDTVARINHLNEKKADHFMEVLLETRPDLAGLPVRMGEVCRTNVVQTREFTRAAKTVKEVLLPPGNFQSASFLRVKHVEPPRNPAFWEKLAAEFETQDRWAYFSRSPDFNATVTAVRIAALMQVLAPESPALRLGLVNYLRGVSHSEAARALARLAVFSPEKEVRLVAVYALKGRPTADYTAVLLMGLRYPLPAVFRNAAEAIVKLQRNDLVPQLVDLLDKPDPRAPVLKEVNGRRVPVVHEVVRINHHRNCFLCHTPTNTKTVPMDTLTAAVPIPNEPLPSPSQGYQSGPSDILVRIDVTYLRQDFSRLLPVADGDPWPTMQRFDFLVRCRVLPDKEAKNLEQQFGRRAPGTQSSYHRAIVRALQDLTGEDAEPTSQAWRELLGLAANKARVIAAQR